MPRRDILTLCVGQGGCQLGNAVWDQYSEEHAILPDRSCSNNLRSLEDREFLTFFEETSDGKFFARNISIDLDPEIIQTLRTTRKAALYRPEHLISGPESSERNFAVGRKAGDIEGGSSLVPLILEAIRNGCEKADYLDGFMLLYSAGGGTGSGLSAVIQDNLSASYRKQSKIGFQIYPSASILDSSAEIFNCAYSTHRNAGDIDVSYVFDNEALYNLCWKNLDIREPTYASLNRLVAKVVSGVTDKIRHWGDKIFECQEYQTDLVPFPRLHFMTTSLAPIASSNRFPTTDADIAECQNCLECMGWDPYVAMHVAEFLPKKRDLRSMTADIMTKDVLDSSNFLVHYPDFTLKEGLYMAICVQYRLQGHRRSKRANEAVVRAKRQGLVKFVEWMPTGFKIEFTDYILKAVHDDDFAVLENSVLMQANNLFIGNWFQKRITQRFGVLLKSREHVQRYVDADFSEEELREVQEDLNYLYQDYQDVLS